MQDTIPFLTTIITKAEADEMNPLVLAFVGDSVQQLYVRTGALHKLATKEIKAEAQADKIEKLLPCLFEEEIAVYKRARNAHYSSSAKNASIGDYKKASGFEALLGYLYLTGNHDRLNELLSIE